MDMTVASTIPHAPSTTPWMTPLGREETSKSVMQCRCSPTILLNLDNLCATFICRVPYLALAKTFERIEEESKRLKIIATLTNFFRSVFLLSPDEMVQCVYLCLNKVWMQSRSIINSNYKRSLPFIVGAGV